MGGLKLNRLSANKGLAATDITNGEVRHAGV